MGISWCRELSELGELAAAEGQYSLRGLEKAYLAPGGRLTVMMFGMTGSGKSALGNLLAGYTHFQSGDDTSSVTGMSSIKSYRAPDRSLLLLDSIGLGDTEIDQEKVVASIRDVALSVTDGIDVMLFVIKHGRITDDTIARLIYVTEYLWGSECLLNLYVVVTFANRYMTNKEEADSWIQRQVEINWRFEHIYKLVGSNPNRFIFIDNPDPESQEPFWRKRREYSRHKLMMALAKHPRDIIPPFTHAMMRRAQERTEKARAELRRAEAQVEEIQRELEDAGTTAEEVSGVAHPIHVAAPTEEEPTEEISLDSVANLEERLKKALESKEEAEKALEQAMDDLKVDHDFQEAAEREAKAATDNFAAKFQNAPITPDLLGSVKEKDSDKAPDQMLPSISTASSLVVSERSSAGLSNPIQACKRMISALRKKLVNPMSKGKSKANDELPYQSASQQALARHSFDDLERQLEELVQDLSNKINGDLEHIFIRLDQEDVGSIAPRTFQEFINEVQPGLSRTQLGALWHRGDTNLDGRLDSEEFCKLLSRAPVSS